MKYRQLQRFKLPDAPGIYFFKKGRKILYIGKATSLKYRVKSYFTSDLISTRGPRIVQMVSKATAITFEKTDSVLESLLLEAELIKKYQPHFNTIEKDDKSFNCVVITDDEFPRVLVIRKRELDFASLETRGYKLKAIYGPFPNGLQLREAMKIIRRIFPYRDDKCVAGIGKPCFNRQIGFCPGTCTGEITKQEYARTIRDIGYLFSGKKSMILKNMKVEMKKAAKNHDFERAGAVKKTLFALMHIQDVGLIKNTSVGAESKKSYRIEAYDIAHTSGSSSVGVMVVLDGGVPKKSEYRKFIIRGGYGNDDISSLTEIIKRRLKHVEWTRPNLLVIDGGIAQKNAVEKIIGDSDQKISIVSVQKNEKHKPHKIIGNDNVINVQKNFILLANNEAHRFAITFHRKCRRDSFILSR